MSGSGRPNILVLMPDQFRADCLGVAAHPCVQTPELDRLARDGTRFEGCYSASPICMPARAAFLTGKPPQQTGMWRNQGRVTTATPTYAQIMSKEGYRTGHIGKSHYYEHLKNTHLRDELPYMRSLGLEDVQETTGPHATRWTDSILSDHWERRGLLTTFREDYRRREEHRKRTGREALWPSPVPEEEHMDSFVGTMAVTYLLEYRDSRPFCLFVGFGGPHEPWDPPASWAQRYESTDPPSPLPTPELSAWLTPEAREYQSKITNKTFPDGDWQALRRLYYAKVSHVDHWIGRILSALDARGLTDSTHVIFFSDHGERACDRGGLYKSVFFDDSVRVPAIIRRADGQNAGQVVPGLCSNMDLLPTMLDMGGLESRGWIGKSLLPSTLDAGAALHDVVGSQIEFGPLRTTMIRTARGKLVVDQKSRALQMFDVQRDPHEMSNLVGNPDATALENDLRRSLREWMLIARVN